MGLLSQSTYTRHVPPIRVYAIYIIIVDGRESLHNNINTADPTTVMRTYYTFVFPRAESSNWCGDRFFPSSSPPPPCRVSFFLVIHIYCA